VPVSNSHSCLIPVSLSVCVSVPACRTNAELNRNITLLRAERLSLKGSQFQLECENASLRTRLQQAQDREQDLINQLEQYKTSDSVVNNGNSPGSTSITEQQLQVRIKYSLHNRSYGQAQGASQPSAPAVTMNGADNHPQSLWSVSVQNMRQSLATAITALQAVGLILPPSASNSNWARLPETRQCPQSETVNPLR
jgi:hypothetical protein